ncbi:MAG: hypothetical protein H6773_03870 [Pseudomonadales bacterium]|nr:hypothetical protein [Candidatus Woesebacteria bacterium]MCB9801295.1 hypothetical protein [Pseudomonadales bacterium]
MTHSKKIIIPALAIAGLLTVGAFSASTVQAMEAERGLPLAMRIAERFGLNESDVEEVFSQYRVERQVAAQERFEEHLASLVEDGTLTQEQSDAIIQKHEEMRADHEALMNATPEERDAYREQHRAEMKAWAEEQGIDTSEIMPAGGPVGPKGERNGNGDGQGFGRGGGMGMHP